MSSLTRVLEPEVMDTKEEAVDYDSMDHSTVNRVFVDDLLENEGIDGDVLDLGTGTAQIPIELVQRELNVRVMAVDMSIEMLELARYNVEANSAIEQITLDHVDAKQLPYDDEMFDLVMSNSIVHHIPEPLGVLREAVRVLRPGGLIFFRDLFRPESDAEVKRLVELYAGDENAHQQKMFDDSLRAALTVPEMAELISTLGLDPTAVKATSDRHWTWCGRKPEVN